MNPYTIQECKNQKAAESNTPFYGSASLLVSLLQALFRCIYDVCLQ